jgi:hypothetical protein
MQNSSEFWQSLGGKMKVALNFTVTISVQPSQPFLAAQPVIDNQQTISQTGGIV